MLRTTLLTALLSLGLATAAVAETPAATPATPAAATATPAASETRDVKLFFDETFNDMKEELETAKTDGKKGLLIMFEMDECPFCHRMKTTVLNRSDIQDYYKENFRVISVDIEGDLELTNFSGETTTQKDFALKDFRVRATPVFQFIDLEGKLYKIQCKSSSLSADEKFISLKTQSTNIRTMKSTYYTKDEIDFFYTCHQGVSYLIPVENAGKGE